MASSRLLNGIKNLIQLLDFIIRTRLGRVRCGNLGNFKRITGSNGIWELIIDHGPGYRIYFGKINDTTIILLYAGIKKTQASDIETADFFWRAYKEN